MGEVEVYSFSIFEWINRHPDSKLMLTESERSEVFSRFTQNYGTLFIGEDKPSLEDEESHYAYYYGDKTCRKEFKFGKPYLSLEECSHEWIAGALFSLAMSTSSSTLLEQVSRCHAVLEKVSKTRSDHPQRISEQHLFAYEMVLWEICSRAGVPLPQKVSQAGVSIGEGYFAAIYFLQGFVSYLIDPDCVKTLEYFRTAREMEPNYFFWWHISFLSGRQNPNGVTTQEFLEYARLAYQNARKGPFQIQTGIALIMAGLEDAEAKGLDYWRSGTWTLSHFPTFRSILDLVMEDSKQLSAVRRKWACLKIGELYIQSGRSLLDWENEVIGRELLEDCLSRWPTCLITLNAMAAFYDVDSPSGLFAMDKMMADKFRSMATNLQVRDRDASADSSSDSSNESGNTLQGSQPVSKETPKSSNGMKKSSTPPDDVIKDWQQLFSSFNAECAALWVINSMETLPRLTAEECFSLSKDETTDREVDIEEWLSTQVSVLSLAFALGHVKVSKKILKSCLKAVKANPEEIESGNLPVFRFLLKTSEICLKFTKFKCKRSQQRKKRVLESKEEEFKQKMVKIQEEWLNVQDSSVVHCIKGRITALLSCENDVKLTATATEPLTPKNIVTNPKRIAYHQPRKSTFTSSPKNVVKDSEKLFSSFKAECSPLWVVNLMDRLPRYTVEKYPDVSQYLSARLLQREFKVPLVHNDGSDREEKAEDGGSFYEVMLGLEEWLCTQISVLSLAFTLGQVKVSREILKSCTEAVETNQKFESGHLPAFLYLLQTSEICLEFTEFKKKVVHGKKRKKQSEVKENEFKRRMLEIQEEWSKVWDSPVVHYVKGRIAALMGCVHDISLEQYRRAMNLEPGFYLWHQAIYEKLKQMRASSASANKNQPGTEELRACQRAHELQPENVKILMDLATVKIQDLCYRLKKNSGQGHGMARTEMDVIAGLLRKVITYSPENSRYQMLAKIKTAELYTTRGLPQRNAEAEAIFLECYEQWPKSSMVLHKVGKFYHYIALNKYVKAQKIYGEGLEVCRQNYPCLMDYLTLLGRQLRKYGEMVDLIDKSLPFIKEPEHVVNLLVIKGQACWLHKKMKIAACEIWIEAFTNFEYLASKISSELAASYSSVFGRLEISLAEMCPLFKEVCARLQIKGNKAIDKFIKFLEKAEEECKRSMWR